MKNSIAGFPRQVRPRDSFCYGAFFIVEAAENYRKLISIILTVMYRVVKKKTCKLAEFGSLQNVGSEMAEDAGFFNTSR